MSYIDTFHAISNAAELLQFHIKAAAYKPTYITTYYKPSNLYTLTIIISESVTKI
jgi:hypothetical protein